MLQGASASVIAAGLSRSAHAATPALVEAAEKEGKVVVYGDSSMVPFLVEGFAKQYPKIQATTVTGGSWDTYNRFLMEKGAGRTIADVLMGADDDMLTAYNAGHLTTAALNQARYSRLRGRSCQALRDPATHRDHDHLQSRSGGQAFAAEGLDRLRQLGDAWKDLSSCPIRVTPAPRLACCRDLSDARQGARWRNRGGT